VIEALTEKGLMKLLSNSRNRASASWECSSGCPNTSANAKTHFVAVDPRETTTECSDCGIETEKSHPGEFDLPTVKTASYQQYRETYDGGRW
jgi:rRNA maturation protein Nop10